MKPTKAQGLFLAVFLILCLIPSVGLLCFGPSEAGANEIAPSAPRLTAPDGSPNAAYLSDLTDYVGRRFFLRQELITAHNRLVSGVFGTSAEDDVLLGQDGWLFYGSTLADFTGSAPMTDREIFAAAHNLALMQEYCAANGTRFLFTAAPNKNSLYPEQMRPYPIVSTQKNAARLQAALAREGVAYLDLFSVFRAQPDALYFAHDSHWNSRGAALGADCINDALGRESAYFSDAFSGSVRHDGDLYAMLYPAAGDPEQDPVYGGTLSFTHETENARPDSITLDTVSGGSGTLVMFRDSFGNLLYPYLSDSFARARFSRQTAYDLTAAPELDADCLVIELVERNLIWLTQQRFCMPAPARAADADAASDGGRAQLETSTARTPAGCVRLDGVLPETPETEATVLVGCGGVYYEAFLLQDGGFTACLPETAQGACSVLCLQDGGAVRYETDLAL